MNTATNPGTNPLDQRLNRWLTLVLADPRAALEESKPAAAEPGPSIWPAGPEEMSPAVLGALVAQLLAEPRFQSERKGQSGISKGRLARLNAPGLTESVARSLMVWFDRAGVLAPPEDGQSPWRAPRPFALSDLDQIAAKLRATPLPTGAEVQAAYRGEA